MRAVWRNKRQPLWRTLMRGRTDLTWAGPSLGAKGFCFGTEDGGVVWADFDGRRTHHVARAARRGEAVNGVAFNAGRMVVSTRNEVMYWNMPSGRRTNMLGGELRFGAHGVVAGRHGDFFLPLGVGGLLAVKHSSARAFTGWVNVSDARDLNIYRVASLATAAGDQVVACAVRKKGLAFGRYAEGKPFVLTTVATGGDDYIDICPLEGKGAGAAAALTRDGKLLVFRNVLTDRKPRAVRYDGFGGTAYRVLNAGSFTFVLTSRALHVIHNLVEPHAGGLVVNGTTAGLSIPMEAVDVNLVGSRWLLAVMPDQVRRLDLSQLRQTLPRFTTEASQQAAADDGVGVETYERELTVRASEMALV